MMRVVVVVHCRVDAVVMMMTIMMISVVMPVATTVAMAALVIVPVHPRRGRAEVEVHEPRVHVRVLAHRRDIGIVVVSVAVVVAIGRGGVVGGFFAGQDQGGGLDELEAEAELVGLDVGEPRDGAFEEEVGG